MRNPGRAPLFLAALLLPGCAGNPAPGGAEAHRPAPEQSPTFAAAGRHRMRDEVFFVPEIPPALLPEPPAAPLEVDVEEIGEEFLPPIPLQEEDAGWAPVEFAPEGAACVPAPAIEAIEVRTYEVEEVQVETVVWEGVPVLIVQGYASRACGRLPAAVPDPCYDPCAAVPAFPPPEASPPPPTRPAFHAPAAAPRRGGGSGAAREPRPDRPREEPRTPVHRREPAPRTGVPAAAILRPTVESYTGSVSVGTSEAAPVAAAPRTEAPRHERLRPEEGPRPAVPAALPAPRAAERSAPDPEPRHRQERAEEAREQRQEAREERREQRQEPRHEPRNEPERAAPIRHPDPPAPAARPQDPPAPPPPPKEHHHRRGKD